MASLRAGTLQSLPTFTIVEAVPRSRLRPRSPLRHVTAVVVAASVLLAACSSDTSGNGAGPTEPPEVTRAEYADLLAVAGEASVRVAYRLTDGLSDPPVEEEIVFAQTPPRVAVHTEEGVVIDNGDGSLTSCTLGSDASCVRLPGVGDAGAGLLSDFLGVFAALVFSDESADLAGYTPEPGRVIAGRPAVCASFETGPAQDSPATTSTTDPTAEGARIRIMECVDEESGVPLALVAENEEGTAVRLEAVEVSQPADEDFLAPAEVPETPEGGGAG